MYVRKLIAALALLSVAASAQAGRIAVLPESASVTLIFAALAVLAFAFRRAPAALPSEAAGAASPQEARER